VGPEAHAEELRRRDPSRNMKDRNKKGTATIFCLSVLFSILSASISCSIYLQPCIGKQLHPFPLTLPLPLAGGG
jgi:hypothetical protein